MAEVTRTTDQIFAEIGRLHLQLQKANEDVAVAQNIIARQAAEILRLNTQAVPDVSKE